MPVMRWSTRLAPSRDAARSRVVVKRRGQTGNSYSSAHSQAMFAIRPHVRLEYIGSVSRVQRLASTTAARSVDTGDKPRTGSNSFGWWHIRTAVQSSATGPVEPRGIRADPSGQREARLPTSVNSRVRSPRSPVSDAPKGLTALAYCAMPFGCPRLLLTVSSSAAMCCVSMYSRNVRI